jgi:hypothetical protein
MKISHELPLSLMSYSTEWNDYDYCLPHLVDKYEQYRIFFQRARLHKRFIIMDNGLFEGVTHTVEDLLDKINMIRPSVFVVPDAWNDSITTIKNAKHWVLNYKSKLPEETKLMAVCQGDTMSDLISTYQILVDLGFEYIAFNHSSIAYQKEYDGDKGMGVLKSQMYGRMELIRRLNETSTINASVHHHLLGCSLPQEFMAYGNFDFIKSVDTSNPILVGAEGKRYTDSGLTWKPKEKLEYYFEKDLSGQIEDIKFNVQRFKTFIK